MHYEDVTVTIERGIAVVLIDRGDGRNPARPSTMVEVAHAVTDCSLNPAVRALILTGAGRNFCAGADFKFLSGLPDATPLEIRDHVYSAFQGAARAVWGCAKPTVAAVNGAAITVGCELSLLCDFRIVGQTAFFQESWIRLGVMPPLGGLMLLPRLIGLGRANEMVFLGRRVDAQEALAWGLASRVVENDSLLTEAKALGAELAALPPVAFNAIKDGIHRGLSSDMDKEWATNLLSQSMLITTDDFREGVNAAMEGRPATFNGR